MKKLVNLLGVGMVMLMPAVTFALGGGDIGTVPDSNNAFDILGVISNIFGILIPILVTLAVIYVIVGVIKYATASDDETQATARKSILSGIIALFVIVSIWGLVAILNSTFGVGQGGQNIGVCQEVYNPQTDNFELPPGC
jgi:uncharacterized membrane protein